MPLLELFSGLGAAGMAWGGPVAAAVDQSPYANEVYTANHGCSPKAWNLAGVRLGQLSSFAANRWWLSPPCQPFTLRGLRRDLEDPRVRPLLRVLEHIVALRPAIVAMENVPGFVVSATRAHVRTALEGAGYTLNERVLCPTTLGVPMRRPRYYLVATQGGSGEHTANFEAAPAVPPVSPLARYLDALPEPDLYLSEATVRAYGYSANILDAGDPTVIATCFTSAYGRSPVRAGSYLRDVGGVRRFSPQEILRLLGFPADFRLPPAFPARVGYDLAGNSLSVDAVRAVLRNAGVLDHA